MLDSGATHAVRPRTEKDTKVKNVTVELAGNMKIKMKMNDAETIVGEEGIPVIVPLIPLMKRLKCTLSTNQGGNLQIEHPMMGIPPVDSSSGAPLLSKEVCQKLIEELDEDTRKRKETCKDEPEKEE